MKRIKFVAVGLVTLLLIMTTVVMGPSLRASPPCAIPTSIPDQNAIMGDSVSRENGGLYHGGIGIDGSADEFQLAIEANSTQTADLFNLADSAGTDLLVVESDGALKLGVATPVVITTPSTGDIIVSDDLEVMDDTILSDDVTINGDITLENDETIVNSTNGSITMTVAATGNVGVSTGNLHVGNGTETTAMDGEDAYIEGTFEVDGTSRFDGAISGAGLTLTGKIINTIPSAIAVTDNSTITPANSVIVLSAAGTCATGSIAAGVSGQLLIIIGPAANTVTISDTGTLKLGGDRALSANDTLSLINDGTNWNEIGFVNN